MRYLIVSFLLLIGSCAAFTTVPSIHRRNVRSKKPLSSTCLHAEQRTRHNDNNSFLTTTTVLGLAVVLTTSPLLVPPVPAAYAYEQSDYASDTVTRAVTSLKNARGNADDTFAAYETVASIITEGKGVGGNINYQGVQLDRGYIADEDTAIYNPGLTLLTESEKERLTEAVIGARKAGLQSQTWTENNEVAYDFLKSQLDPLHMTELRGYLKIVPLYGAVLYVVTLAVQQFARGVFPAVYLLAAAAVFAPIAVLIALGPQ